jgi:hypothetical protein
VGALVTVHAAAADVSLSIAGLALHVEARDHALTSLVRDRYAGFVAPRAMAGWRISFVVAERSDGGPEDVVVDGGAHRFRIARHDFRGDVDTSARVATIAVAPRETAVDSALRVVMSLALAIDGGLMVHAASLARGDRGYVFAGPSGSGKTTLARLSDATLLSDELSIVRIDAGRVRCHGTPFWGELARGGDNRAVPLAAFYRLRKASAHRRRPLARGAALAALLENVMWFSRDAAAVRRVVEVAGAIIERVPCYELEFRRDDGFWTVVEDA